MPGTRKYIRRRPIRRAPARRMRAPFKRPVVARNVYYPALPARGNMSKTGVPNLMSLQMKTMDNVAGAGATHQEYALKLNSTFDPCGDLSAVQPAGRDQIATLYGSYIVESGAVKITFVNNIAKPVYVCCYTSGQAAVAQGVNNYGTQPGAKYKLCGPNTGSNNTVTIIKPFKISSIVGPLDRSQHGAAVGSDPASLAYCYFEAWEPGNATNLTGCHWFVEIIQNTTWYDKIPNVHA